MLSFDKTQNELLKNNQSSMLITGVFETGLKIV